MVLQTKVVNNILEKAGCFILTQKTSFQLFWNISVYTFLEKRNQQIFYNSREKNGSFQNDFYAAELSKSCRFFTVTEKNVFFQISTDLQLPLTLQNEKSNKCTGEHKSNMFCIPKI